MEIIGPLLVLCAVAGVFYLRSRLLESQDPDYEAIDDLLKSRRWRTIDVTRNDAYRNYSWRYMLRRMAISNCARIYVVLGERPGGDLREVLVAFDPWNSRARRGLQVLLEREVDRPAGGKVPSKPTAADDLL